MYVNLLIIYIQGIRQQPYVESDETGLHWWSSSCEHIYFQIETMIREIVQALRILCI